MRVKALGGLVCMCLSVCVSSWLQCTVAVHRHAMRFRVPVSGTVRREELMLSVPRVACRPWMLSSL